MDSLVSEDHPNTHHPRANTQLHTTPRIRPYVQTQTLQEESHPSKRRRANSLIPPISVVSHVPPLPTTDQYDSPLWQRLDTTQQQSQTSLAPRANSPDRVSRVSTASSVPTSGPQLRKKPKSNSIQTTNILRSGTATVLNSQNLTVLSPSAQYSGGSGSVATQTAESSGQPISRTNSGTSQHQSPTQKRPPASHSSYGIATICGPPPSYSTQRTLSQERIKKLDRNTSARMHTSSSDQVNSIALDGACEDQSQQKEREHPSNQYSPDTVDSHSVSTPTDTDTMANIQIRGEQRLSADEEAKASSSDERKSEDLFLNIARVDAARQTQPKTEKRRSRISIPFLPSNRSAHLTRSSPLQPQYDQNPFSIPAREMPPLHIKHASLGGEMSSSITNRNRLIESDRFRERSVDRASNREQAQATTYAAGLRRASTTNTEPTKLAHRTSTGLRSGRLISEIANQDHARIEEHIATESTISTTAPSTVWDELDDLKSRIRKLELTGKLPPSSAAAMASTERPRTATTAATTMSTSPKYKPSETNLASAMEGSSSHLQPLLHEALDNARTVLSNDIYQKLQATAQDALQLAAMMNTETNSNRAHSVSMSSERQLRRKTESMCRGLTELAIALAAEAKPVTSTTRPLSREQSLPPNSMLKGRRYSNDTTDRGQLPSRVQSRIDNRRTSVHLARNGAGYSSPEYGMYSSPVSSSQIADARINRSSTLLRNRGQGSFDGADDLPDASPSIRPGSRAMTDIGTYRHMSRDPRQTPREYTSRHPLPSPREQTGVTTIVNSSYPVGTSGNLTSRRKYNSPASMVVMQENGPMTPRETWNRMSAAHFDTQSPDMASDVGASARIGSSRRSLVIGSRNDSSVGSRLRAARNSREHIDSRGNRDMVPSMYSDHMVSPATADVYKVGNTGERR